MCGKNTSELVQLNEDNDVYLLMCQESLFDVSILEVHTPNFSQISRKDRSVKANRGGVVAFARQDVNNIVFLKHVDGGERSWHLCQRDTGSIAICNWYLSPNAPLEELDAVEQEIREMSEIADSILVAGDLNVHQRSWLRYSREDTTRGNHLKEICDKYGLRQLVSVPTRGDYLLDLVLSNQSDIKVHLGPKIADHSCLLVCISDIMESRNMPFRRVWHYRDADWKQIQQKIAEYDLQDLKQGAIDNCLQTFVDFLRHQMHAHIPQSMREMRKTTLPWLNDRCALAIARKHALEGGPEYLEACTKCSQVLCEEKQKHMTKLKNQLETLPKSSKRWWTLNKQLLNRQSSPSFFPPIKNKSGDWCRTAELKANAFVETWSAKNVLPPETFEQAFFYVPPCLPDWFPIRRRFLRRLLMNLRLDQATGPDEISARFLRVCADVLALPLAILCRRIFTEAS